GSSLQCYSCSTQLSNSNCLTKKTCAANDVCKTDVIRIVGLVSIINKGCDSSCEATYKDFSVGNRNISCCSSDLCNANAAGSLRPSHGLAAGVAAAVLWTVLQHR
ncbi:PSCA protein, partial [Alaudala cheleensis]|nr:PSCA protein [Alaudala cheleensis]